MKAHPSKLERLLNIHWHYSYEIYKMDKAFDDSMTERYLTAKKRLMWCLNEMDRL